MSSYTRSHKKHILMKEDEEQDEEKDEHYTAKQNSDNLKDIASVKDINSVKDLVCV